MSAKLEGTWLPVAADVSGQELLVSELRVSRLVLHEDGYQIIDKADEVVDRGNYRVDDSVFPLAMDIVGVSGPYAGRTMHAIYELRNDRLKGCYDLETTHRPADMEAEGEELLLSITYARASAVLS